MKTVFTYVHVKWFYGQSEHAYYLNYFIMVDSTTENNANSVAYRNLGGERIIKRNKLLFTQLGGGF